MQFLKVAHELITDTKITSNEFRIYAYLMMLYNEKNGCSFPSMETIADKLGLSKRTVVTSIKKLEEFEYIKVEKQKAKIGNYNKYVNFKYLMTSKRKAHGKEVPVNPVPVDSEGKKPIDNQIHITDIEGVTEYTSKHKINIDMVKVKKIRLTEKQEMLLKYFDFEILKNALNSKEIKNFNYVIDMYYVECTKKCVIPNINIQKFCKNPYIVPVVIESEIDMCLRIEREMGIVI